MTKTAQGVAPGDVTTTLGALCPRSEADRIATLETIVLALWERVMETEECAAETTDPLQDQLDRARARRKLRS